MYERCTSVYERSGKKIYAARQGQIGRRTFEQAQSLAWVRRSYRKGVCGGRGGDQLMSARTRDTRALHERLREIGQKNFARQDRRAEAGRGAWLWGSTKRQRKGIQSIGLRSGCRVRGAGDGWHGRSGARGRWKAWLPARPKVNKLYIIYFLYG